MSKRIWNLVITGGPCSGKSSVLSKVKQELTNLGYYVLIIPETATELISNGISPFNNSLDLFTFQHLLFEKQLHKEELFRRAANIISAEKIVILHDRSLIDSKCYIPNEEFQKILSEFNLDEYDLINRYDAVFHLITAANGAEEFYTLSNNEARVESPEEARKLDELGILSYENHPKFYIFDNSTNFQKKIDRLLEKVYFILEE